MSICALAVTSSDYNVKDKRVMCLIRSMDDIIETFEVASTEVEEEGKEHKKETGTPIVYYIYIYTFKKVT